MIYIKAKYLLYKIFDNCEEDNFEFILNQGKLYRSLDTDNLKN